MVILALLAFKYVGRGTRTEKTEPIMIAVLPFQHSGPDDQQTFADALTDAVTAKPGSLDALAVIDRQSAGQYRGTTKPTKQIGTELGVLFLV